MTEPAYSTAPEAHDPDERSPLRRALDVLPHRAAEIAQRKILDAVAYYERTRDDGPLLAITFEVMATARLESSADFRLAVRQSDSDGQPETEPEAIDHRAYIRSLRG